jgi:hypothetical protein
VAIDDGVDYGVPVARTWNIRCADVRLHVGELMVCGYAVEEWSLVIGLVVMHPGVW